MKVWTLALATVVLSGTALSITTPGINTAEARTARKAAKKAPALIQVRVCPMSGTPVQGAGAGSTVVGKYKVYFC